MKISDVYGVGTPVPKPYKHKIDCVYPEQIIGVELEIEGCDRFSGEEYIKKCKPLNIDVKTDGSLRGVAYEFITKPMTSTETLGVLKDFFDFTGFNEANYSDRCSVHVHSNCADMELEQVSALALLYTVVEEVLFEFVGNNRDSNIYCIPWNQCRMHLNLVNKFLTDSSQVLRGWSKYTALNLLPLSKLGTVEFRQMHGTSDMGKLTQWINIIGALFKYAKTTALKDLITEIKSLNSTSQYEMFFHTILANQLPYNELYREKMEAGVIFAKYSLIGMEDKRKVKATPVPVAAIEALIAEQTRRDALIQAVRRPPPIRPTLDDMTINRAEALARIGAMPQDAYNNINVWAPVPVRRQQVNPAAGLGEFALDAAPRQPVYVMYDNETEPMTPTNEENE